MKTVGEIEDTGHDNDRPGPVVHVGDQGALSPDPIGSTTDPSPPSALGGHSAARSNSKFAPEEDAG